MTNQEQNMFDRQAFITLANKYPKPPGVVFTYGTAGFRTLADNLDSVMFRMGVVAALRSLVQNGKIVGVMLTASHNPEADNGVKIVDPYGDMLETSWEPFCTRVANCATSEELLELIESKHALGIEAKVVYARDTRPSGERLIAALKDGLKAASVGFERDFSLLSTPQLHYMVRCFNDRNFGEPTEQGYYTKLSFAFTALVKDQGTAVQPFLVDCANGVGALKLAELLKHFPASSKFSAELINADTTTPGLLNYQCGADHVKSTQSPPRGLELIKGRRYVSLDGDADRIVFYYFDGISLPNNPWRCTVTVVLGSFRLLDGDKIAGLAAMYIKDLIKTAGLDLRLGVVQTAYANGNSTAYMKHQLKVPVIYAQTGVKHLHHEALKFDVGVYFEANGHGTVLFSESAIKTFQSSPSHSATPAQLNALNRLRNFVDLINQTVGDALSDLLMVEVILRDRHWTFPQWDQAYADLPSRLVKVSVHDRFIFETTEADTVLVKPAGLFEQIQALVAKYHEGRSFVRPSGTEDVVRVYAEAANRTECDELAFKVAGLVFDQAGGKGERPAQFL